MSRTMILSLVSEQTLPNVLFIKAHPEATVYWFVETDRTRKDHKVQMIQKACGLKQEALSSCLVLPDALEFKLPEEWTYSAEDRLLVNLTCGTKMMSLSVYEFIKAKPNVALFYIPVDNTVAICLATQQATELPQISIREYLLAHGYEFSYKEISVSDASLANDLFDKAIKKEAIRSVPEIMAVKQNPSHPHHAFYLGGWFEVYLYGKIKTALGLKNKNIYCGVKLKHFRSGIPAEPDSEIDVLFILNNRLYLIECKVYDGKAKSALVYAAIQKIAIINKPLGLHAKAFICVLSSFEELNHQRLGYLKAIAGVENILSLSDFRSGKTIRQLLKI